MITVETRRPYTLVRRMKELIDEGVIETWSYDDDGDFTHLPPQWRNKAWFHAVRYKGEKVEFRMIPNSKRLISREVYAIYHGRFVEMLMAHLSRYCINIFVSPVPDNKDRIIPYGYED